MKIDITRLKSGIDQYVEVNETLEIENELFQNTDLLDLEEVTVIGEITRSNVDEYLIDCEIKGIMILPCAITLKPVSYPFAVKIVGNIAEMLEEMNENDKKMENTIDIFPIIWENILMEIPMRVVSEDAENISLEGDGWRFVTEENTEQVNPELQKLQDLLKEK